VADSTLTNHVLSRPMEAERDSPLPKEDRFACLPGCGLCCSYRVLVTDADRRRLQEARAVAHAPDAWEATGNGELALRRVSGFCLFLASKQRCAIYDQRPQQCRAYPFLWTWYARAELDVDLSCPGLGHGETVPVKPRQPPAESRVKQTRRGSAIGQLQMLLRAQRRYAAPRALAGLGEHYLDELAAAWAAAPRTGSWSVRIDQRGPFLANVETEDAFPELCEGLSLSRRSVEGLRSDDSFIGRHFARPHLNTRLGQEDAVALYRFWIAEEALHVEEEAGKRREISLRHTGRIPWWGDALATRRAYLERWLKRQLPVRLANNLALADLALGSHVATCYLQFLIEIDWRLAVLAPALALLGGEEVIRRPVALEAIRASDGLLRAWCESARLGSTG
jgi:Fe-S-cluster containining protein